ncbi:MAG: hypothetical protein A2V87_01615 [Deltaproteobacteria bacterium RBG_16_58_17]|nr:MAG: hypothetical protein A2V87_01615 [Deltaproteobacteria bacterium RBG_16_58_17]
MKNQRAGFTLLEFIVALVVAAVIAAIVYSFFGASLTQSGIPIQRLQQTNNLSRVMENIVADFNRLNALNLRYKWRFTTPYTLNSIVVPISSTSTDNTSSNILSNGFYYKCTAAGTSGTTVPTWPTTIGATRNDGTVTWTTVQDVEVWQASHTYNVGTIVIPTLNNGHYYKCTTAGTSAANEPSSENTPANAWPTSPGGTIPSPDGTVTWTEVGTILDSSEANIENLYTYLTTQPARYGTGYTLVAAETKFIQFNSTAEVNAGELGTSSEKNILKVTIKNNDSAETLTELFTIR